MPIIRAESMRFRYFEREDTLYMFLAEGEEASGLAVSPNITAELDAEGQLIGIEILDASRYLRDSILDSVEAKVVQLSREKDE